MQLKTSPLVSPALGGDSSLHPAHDHILFDSYPSDSHCFMPWVRAAPRQCRPPLGSGPSPWGAQGATRGRAAEQAGISDLNKEHCKKPKGFSLMGLWMILWGQGGCKHFQSWDKTEQKFNVFTHVFNIVIKRWVRNSIVSQVLDPTCPSIDSKGSKGTGNSGSKKRHVGVVVLPPHRSLGASPTAEVIAVRTPTP